MLHLNTCCLTAEMFMLLTEASWTTDASLYQTGRDDAHLRGMVLFVKLISASDRTFRGLWIYSLLNVNVMLSCCDPVNTHNR